MNYKVKTNIELITTVNADDDEMAKQIAREILMSLINETKESDIHVEIVDKGIDENIINDETNSKIEDELEREMNTNK